MPDIDSLSIRLTSSSKGATDAIDNVIKALEKLNGALNNYTDDSKFVKGMGSLTGGLKGIATSINSIDLEKMKNLSTVLGKLSGAGTKIAQLNFAKPFAEVGASVQQGKSEVNTFADDFVKQFRLPKEATKEVSSVVERMFKTTSQYSFDNKLNELAEIARKYGYVSDGVKDLAEAEKKLKHEVTSTNMHISKQTLSNFGDAAKQIRGNLNLRSTFTDLSKGVDVTTVVEEMGYVVESEREALDKLLELTAQEAEFTNQSATLTEVEAYFDDIKNSVLGASSAMKQLNADEEFMSVDDGDDPFSMIDTNAPKAVEAVNNVQTAVQNLQSQAIQEMANPFEGLITGLEALKEVDLPAEKFAGISQLANSIGKFGGKNSDKAVTNIPRFTKAFAEMAAQLANAPQISDNLVRLAEAMSKFSTKSQTATKSATKFGGVTKVLNHAFSGMYPHTMRAHRGFTSLAAIFGRLYANFFLVIRAARALGRAIDYSSSMTEAQNVVAVTFGRNSEVMDKFAQSAIKDFGMARLSATEFASRFQAMGSTMGITADKVVKANDFIRTKIAGNTRAYQDLGNSVADMSINLTKLTADMASLYNQDYADVAQDMQAIYTGMTRPLRKYGLDLTQATLKEWALANGLDADIDKMSQAQKTMLRYQYVMSRTAGAMGDFTKTADTWANAMRTVKQLLQEVARTIGEALINALRPALLQFRNFLFNFLELTQSALNALGKLLGWKQINFASATLVDDTEDYADALDDAAGAAKKLKGQLRGIDELNNLTTNDKSGGSGSGLSGLAATIDDLINNANEDPIPYESAIKSWYEFGQKISYAIRDGLAKIDWTEIRRKVSEFGTNLASWLNGLIQPDTFHQIGRTIANGINTAIDFAFSFGKEFNWEGLGESIGNGINGFFEEFENGKLVETFNLLVEGIKKTFKKAFETIKWGEVFESLWEFIRDIDKDPFALAAAIAGISGLFIAAAMANPIAIPAITVTIGAAYIVGKSIGELIMENEDNPLGISLSILLGGAAQLDKDKNPFKQQWFWENGSRGGGGHGNDPWYKQIVDSIPFADIAEPYKEFYGGLWDEITDFVSIASLIKHIKDKQDKDNTQKLKDFVKELYIDPWIDAFKYWTSNPDVLSDLGIMDWIDGVFEDIIENIPEIYEELLKEFKEWSGFDEFDSVGEMIVKGILQGMISVSDGGIDVKFLFDAIKNAICSIFGIESPAKEMNDVGENIVLGILKGFDLVDFAGAMSEWWENNVAPWFTLEKWNELLQPIRLAFKYAFQAGANFAVGALNKVLEGLENMMNGAGDLFNALIELASKIVKKDLEKWGRITLPRIATPYANGGYPQVGSLFLAGEAGSEMVGTINGRTGVVSNGEITGIADAIRSTSDTEIQLLRQQNSLLQGILNKEFGISSDNIFNSVRNSAREYTNMTGQPAW